MDINNYYSNTFFMRKICLIAAAMMGFVLSSVVALGQVDEMEPGIYAMVEGEPVPLGFVNGTTAVSTTGVLGVEVGKSSKAPSSKMAN